ncbi:hypothetical protein H6F78_06930 [Coleofasciculus sp. FACHB-64]|uniref:hypothetical protein n=1 Tax=Cyanophyceae TaxID=3028117 RepID=UPI00168616BD|nr:MULTISPECIES: hypothetical protein [unclassified Coleofasciculus]MBD1840772.1 hypothetical protein [Coleofasciculus sp. FACHB-501]MBD2045331.1 hypothetical protein [Coleofasciculus sp. FACHB-64]MBD2537842.1 hypothetical protein [Coleofasciculus sp. FACHB-SPT36]
MGIHRGIVSATFLIFTGLSAIAPPVFSQIQEFTTQQPERQQIDLIFSPNTNQSFEDVLEQAESIASNSVEQGFAQNPEVTQIYIRIFGDVKGQVAPLLFSKVYRSDWQTEPKIDRWIRYFDNSGLLLGFYNNSSNSSSPPIPPTSTFSREDDPGFRDD